MEEFDSLSLFFTPPPVDNEEVIFFTENNSNSKKVTPSVTLYLDSELRSKVQVSEQINKDKIHFFVLNSVPKLTTTIIFDENIALIRKNSVNYGSLIQGNSIFPKLLATVVDSEGKKMEVCKSCEKEGKTKMFLGRKISCHGDSIELSASITCSGNPTSSTRLLKVIFQVCGEHGAVIWEGETSTFTIFHHRKKRGLKEEEPQDIVKHHKLLRPNISYPFVKSLSPSVKEMCPYLNDIFLADSRGQFFNNQLLHLTLRCLDYHLKQCEQVFLNKNMTKALFEFMTNLNGIREYTWDPMSRYHGDFEILNTVVSFHFNQAAKAVKGAIDIGTTSLWESAVSSLWKDLFHSPKAYLDTFCDCEDCVFSHLALVVTYGKKFLTMKQICDFLNKCKVPTKQSKSWHNSLNSLLDRKSIHFNCKIYFSDTPIGIFSRAIYPPSHVKSCFFVYFNRRETEEIKESQRYIDIGFPKQQRIDSVNAIAELLDEAEKGKVIEIDTKTGCVLPRIY